MTSQLTWLDHDTAAHDRMQRILALFREKDARDELGLGTVRDSIADLLFPGTSTIQTRLRYMLFVPWVYKQLEQKGCSSENVARDSRKLETQLVAPLLASDDQAGVFGRRAKGEVKRLPSSVYWAGLRSWGVLQFGGSITDYHRSFDRLARRKAAPKTAEGDEPARETEAWNRTLPKPPADFPEALSLALTQDEARWLKERIQAEHEGSLLCFLATHGIPDDVAVP
jgi:hypothetical protein